MKVIKIDLGSDLESVELITFADEHIGEELCDMKRLTERIEYVKNTPNAYCILNGDILDNATKTSIGDTYSQTLDPMEQLEKAVELFACISHKVICVDKGNHEHRSRKNDGIDLSYLIAARLGLLDRYTPTSAFIFLRFGRGGASHHYRKICYTINCTHGSGGGRADGGKMNRLVEMASICDADIYIHSHTHTPMVVRKSFYRVDNKNSAVALVDKLFVNTAANLRYGGYGEAAEFKPSSMDTPVIYLSGTRKEFRARL